MRAFAWVPAIPATLAACALAMLVVGPVASPASGGRPAPRGGAPASGTCTAAAFPARITSLLIGRSVRGRAIVAHRLGDPCATRRALVVGVIHGDETAGLGVTAGLRRAAIHGVDLWVIDSINPDGRRAGVRRNADGVDLNRNFPAGWRAGEPPGSGYYPGPRALSEPETRAVRSFLLRLRPNVSVWYHQPWGAVLLPCRGPASVQRRYSRISGLGTSCRGDGLPGTAIRWENVTFPGSTAMVVEFPGGSVGSATLRRHVRAAVAIAEGPPRAG